MKVTGLPNTTAITVAGNGLQNFYTDYRNSQIGDPFTFKSDFVKLRNISLAYNFTDLIKKGSCSEICQRINIVSFLPQCGNPL